jgi:hypothetical protein
MYHGTVTNAIGIAWHGRSGSRLPACLGRDFRLFEPGLARFNSEFRGRQALARGDAGRPRKCSAQKSRGSRCNRCAARRMRNHCPNITTSLINPGLKWFSSRSLALCISNHCALQHHLIRDYACDRPRRSMFKIDQTGFFSSARLPGMDNPRLDVPGSPAVGFEHDRLIFARVRTARCAVARVGEPGSSRAG